MCASRRAIWQRSVPTRSTREVARQLNEARGRGKQFTDASIVGNKDIVKWTVGSYQKMWLSGQQSSKVAMGKQMSMWKPEMNMSCTLLLITLFARVLQMMNSFTKCKLKC